MQSVVPDLFIKRLLNLVLEMKTYRNSISKQQISVDNGERRSGGDRRNYSYTLHIPEKRKGKDRRSGDDRRKFPRAATPLQK